MFGLEFTPSTVVVGLIVIALMFFAIRRMWRNGMCDCHKDEDTHRRSCGECAGCSSVDRMLADIDDAAKLPR